MSRYPNRHKPEVFAVHSYETGNNLHNVHFGRNFNNPENRVIKCPYCKTTEVTDIRGHYYCPVCGRNKKTGKPNPPKVRRRITQMLNDISSLKQKKGTQGLVWKFKEPKKRKKMMKK